MRQLSDIKPGRIAAALLTSAAITASAVSGAQAGGGNPILDEGQTITALNDQDMANVRGSGTTSAYYAYLGNYYASAAIQYASYGLYLELLGSGSNSTKRNYYYSAYTNANSAASNYYNAYYYYNQ